MKKKLVRKLIEATAVAAGVIAGSVTSFAQTETQAATPAPATNDTSISSSGDRPTPPPGSTTPPSRSDGGVAPGTIPPARVAPDGPTILPYPLPDGTNDRGSGTAPGTGLPRTPPSDTGNSGTTVPGGTGGTRGDVKTGTVTLVGVPVRPLPADGTVTALPVAINQQAAGSGVVVYSGDIVRVVSGGETTATPPADSARPASPVLTVVQQFDAQRNQELAARATALEQLRTATTPEQRAAIIADLQATAQRQAVEQREAARELRNDLRTMREERKSK